jgi:hypothetical protein
MQNHHVFKHSILIALKAPTLIQENAITRGL